MEKVVRFPAKKKKDSDPLPVQTVEMIGFLNTHDRDVWIDDPEDVRKIMLFIVREKIKLREDT